MSVPAGKELTVRTELTQKLWTLGRTAQKVAPYLLIELVLPGGTLIALFLFLSRRGYLKPVFERVARISASLEGAIADVDDQLVAPLQRAYAWHAPSGR